MSSPFNFKSLLCKIGIHDMKQTAHWCDRECSIIFVEYTCARCGKEAYEWVHWDPDMTKAIKRIPSDLSSLDAAVLAECGKVQCELASKTIEAIDKQEASGEHFVTEEAPAKKKRNSRKAKPAVAEEVPA